MPIYEKYTQKSVLKLDYLFFETPCIAYKKLIPLTRNFMGLCFYTLQHFATKLYNFTNFRKFLKLGYNEFYSFQLFCFNLFNYFVYYAIGPLNFSFGIVTARFCNCFFLMQQVKRFRKRGCIAKTERSLERCTTISPPVSSIIYLE